MLQGNSSQSLPICVQYMLTDFHAAGERKRSSAVIGRGHRDWTHTLWLFPLNGSNAVEAELPAGRTYQYFFLLKPMFNDKFLNNNPASQAEPYDP